MIRRLGPGDEELLRRIATRWKAHVPDAEAARRFLGDDRHLVFAAAEGDEPVGFLYGYVLDRIDGRRGAFLYDLEVAAEQRGRGLGRALVDAFVAGAAAAGAFKAWVQTDADNEAASRTYAAAGAREVALDLVLGWDL